MGLEVGEGWYWLVYFTLFFFGVYPHDCIFKFTFPYL